MWTDDPIADFHRHDREQEMLLERLPVCENPRCCKRIQDDNYFLIDDEILCQRCMEKKYMRNTEDYIYA